jgi:hypothetical protein
VFNSWRSFQSKAFSWWAKFSCRWSCVPVVTMKHTFEQLVFLPYQFSWLAVRLDPQPKWAAEMYIWPSLLRFSFNFISGNSGHRAINIFEGARHVRCYTVSNGSSRRFEGSYRLHLQDLRRLQSSATPLEHLKCQSVCCYFFQLFYLLPSTIGVDKVFGLDSILTIFSVTFLQDPYYEIWKYLR